MTCFSEAVDNLLDFIEEKDTYSYCTTGLSEEQIGRINELSKAQRFFVQQAGINTLSKSWHRPTLRAASFDRIVEAYRRKLDAPSGTAILLTDAVNEYG